MYIPVNYPDSDPDGTVMSGWQFHKLIKDTVKYEQLGCPKIAVIVLKFKLSHYGFVIEQHVQKMLTEWQVV